MPEYSVNKVFRSSTFSEKSNFWNVENLIFKVLNLSVCKVSVNNRIIDFFQDTESRKDAQQSSCALPFCDRKGVIQVK